MFWSIVLPPLSVLGLATVTVGVEVDMMVVIGQEEAPKPGKSEILKT